MNLQQLNEKYRGKPVDLRAWQYPVFGTPPNMGFGIEAQFSDGKFYSVKGTLVIGGMGAPHEMRKGLGTFDGLANVRVTDAYENPIEDGADRFADEIESLIAPLCGLAMTGRRTISARNNACPWDIAEVIRRYAGKQSGGIDREVIERVVSDPAARRELDAAWERVKRELVHYIACKFCLPEPEDLSDDYGGRTDFVAIVNGSRFPTLVVLRERMERLICSNDLSWTRSLSWVNLRNEMLDQMFDKIGIALPAQAHELMYMLNGRKPTRWERKVDWGIDAREPL